MECMAKALKNSNTPFIWAVKKPDLQEPDGAGQLPLIRILGGDQRPRGGCIMVSTNQSFSPPSYILRVL